MPRVQLKTLTEQMYYVLLALKKERYGVEISQYIEKLTHGRIILGPGTLYAILSKLKLKNGYMKRRQKGAREVIL